MASSSPRHVGGFTLNELMNVVVVAAILAAVALPCCQEHVRKSRPVDAQSAMLEVAQFMERHYTTNNSCAGTTLPGTVTSRVADFCTITLITQSAQAYTLQGAPPRSPRPRRSRRPWCVTSVSHSTEMTLESHPARR